jgi:hypothetical protein
VPVTAGQAPPVRADLDTAARTAAQELAVFLRDRWTGPNEGAVRVVNTHGWVAMLSGTPLPPDSPARISW